MIITPLPKKNTTRGRGTTVVSISLNDVELERLAAHVSASGLSRSGTIACLLFRVTPRRHGADTNACAFLSLTSAFARVSP